MGGLIILAAILIPVLLFAKLNHLYPAYYFTTVWLGVIGFVMIISRFLNMRKGPCRTFQTNRTDSSWVVGTTLFFSESVVIRKKFRQRI